MNTFTEENYLKTIYMLSEKTGGVNTNALAAALNTKASSVTDMIRKLSDKKLINYKRYQGVTLRNEGKKVALKIIRKHRLWEVFLVERLNFGWDEVHDIAEQLEHVVSPELVDRLDQFLNRPKFDPHGDPIPDKNGNYSNRPEYSLTELKKGSSGVLVGVKDSSASFLKYLESKGLLLGTEIKVVKKYTYDQSLAITINEGTEMDISNKVAKNLTVTGKG